MKIKTFTEIIFINAKSIWAHSRKEQGLDILQILFCLYYINDYYYTSSLLMCQVNAVWINFPSFYILINFQFN